ncbi:hypothetical protein Tco_0632748 [Tanacetum coccineum]
MHPTTLIPYPRFTKIIIDHILTEHLDIPKRLNEPYYRVENDEVVKSIFNSGKRKGLGMRIPKWLLTEEIKQTKHYKVYVGELNIEVPMTLSQPIESMQETLSTSGAPMPPNPQEQQARSIEDYEAQQAVKNVDEHLMDEDIENIVEGDEETDADKFVEDLLNKVEEESAEAELKRKKWKGIELTASKPTSSSSKPKTDCSKHIKGVIARMSRRYGYIFCHMKKYFMPRRDMDAIGKEIKDTLKEVVHKMVDETTNQNIKDNLTMVVIEGIKLEWEKTKADIASMVAELALMYKFGKPTPNVDPCRVDTFCSRDHEDHHDDDARPEGEISTKRQRTSEHSTFTRGESSLQTMEESNPSSSSAQEQQEDFDPWSEDQGTDDDEVPSEEVSPELLAEVLGKGITTDDLQRMQYALNDMMRSRCDLGEEHQYHLDQMKSYTESQIKSLWDQQSHIRRQLKKRDDPEEVYSEKRIVDLIKVQFDQGYGKIKYQETGILKSLNVFIRSYVIWERFHGYQLGLEIGLIYENCKKEKRITNIDEILKLCDATLKRVLEKVKKINLDVKHGYADPALSKDDA